MKVGEESGGRLELVWIGMKLRRTGEEHERRDVNEERNSNQDVIHYKSKICFASVEKSGTFSPRADRRAGGMGGRA